MDWQEQVDHLYQNTQVIMRDLTIKLEDKYGRLSQVDNYDVRDLNSIITRLLDCDEILSEEK